MSDATGVEEPFVSSSQSILTSFDDCAGVVLCGGRSARMGSDKASLPLGNESMLQRIVRTLGSVVSPVVVVAAQGQTLPDFGDDVVVVRDEFPDRGPLEGIRVGLQNLPRGRPYAFLSGCDAPLLHGTFIAALLSLRSGYDVVVPRKGEFYYPLTAVYHRGVVSQIESLAQRQPRRPIDLFERVRTLTVDSGELRAADPQLDSLRNINTPQDYQQVMRELGLA